MIAREEVGRMHAGCEYMSMQRVRRMRMPFLIGSGLCVSLSCVGGDWRHCPPTKRQNNNNNSLHKEGHNVPELSISLIPGHSLSTLCEISERFDMDVKHLRCSGEEICQRVCGTGQSSLLLQKTSV